MDKERWQQLSFFRQMGNITSEIVRAKNFEARHDEQHRKDSLLRALELVDLTLEEQKTFERIREIARFREIVCDLIADQHRYEVKLEDLENYCMPYAIAGSLEK